MFNLFLKVLKVTSVELKVCQLKMVFLNTLLPSFHLHIYKFTHTSVDIGISSFTCKMYKNMKDRILLKRLVVGIHLLFFLSNASEAFSKSLKSGETL